MELPPMGTSVDMALWGLWLFPFGRLVARSGFLPRWLGRLLLVNGAAYVALAVVRVVPPAHQKLAGQVLMPFYAAGGLAIIVYLVVWGAREPAPAHWVAPAARMEGRSCFTVCRESSLAASVPAGESPSACVTKLAALACTHVQSEARHYGASGTTPV
jgi:hypothetical protein